MPCLFSFFRLTSAGQTASYLEERHRRNLPDFSRKIPNPTRGMGCAYSEQPEKASAVRRKTAGARPRLLAFRRLEKLQVGKLAAQHEIPVVHGQVAGDAV